MEGYNEYGRVFYLANDGYLDISDEGVMGNGFTGA